MNVLIYSTSICAPCHSLTAWLDKVGVEYTKKITDEDPAAMMEFMTVNDGMVGVPFTIITDDAGNETKISGFNQGEFKKALNI